MLLCWRLVPSSYIQIFILLPPFLNVSLPSFPFSLSFKGEGNEEISNMIHNYIKEIEDLRYLHYMYSDNFYLKNNKSVSNTSAVFLCGDYSRRVVFRRASKTIWYCSWTQKCKMLEIKLTIEMRVECCLNYGDNLILLHQGQ